MRFGFGVPIRGNLVFLFGMALIYLFALLALGLFISTRAKTQAEAQQMAQLFLLPSIFLSGYIFPFEGLPTPLKMIGEVLPATHMVAIMRGVVLRDAGPARADAERARAGAHFDGARRFVRPQFPQSGHVRVKRAWKPLGVSI